MRGLPKFVLAAAGMVGLVMLSAPAIAAPANVISASQSSQPAAVVPFADDIVAAGDVNDFTFESMHADYTLTLGDDGAGYLTVVETYVVNFTNVDTHRGMQRRIPTTYNGAPVNAHLESITDENGGYRAQTAETDGGDYVMTSRAADYVIGQHTYVFTYTLDNVGRYYSDQNVDEFYWDVVGAEWRQPFGKTSMTLVIEPALVDALNGNASCYYGPAGANNACEISRNGDHIEARTSGLAPFEGVTIAVGFEPGTFTPFDGSYLASDLAPWQLGAVGLGLAGVVGTAVVRRTALRDAPGHPTVIAQYEPPAGVDAMNAAVLLRKQTVAVQAEILEQAIRGTIQIREQDSRRGKFKAVLIDPSLTGDANGARLIEALFGDNPTPGAERRFDDEDEPLSLPLMRVLMQTAKEQRRSGVRRTPSALYRFGLAGLFLVIGAAALTVGIMMTSSIGNAAGAVIGSGVLLVMLVCAVLLAKRPFTELGANLRDHLLGLKLFMEWAEADRIRMLQSPEGAERIQVDPNSPEQMLKLYEPLLPYAVAFGIETKWSSNLQTYYSRSRSEPSWYYGATPFSASALSSAVESIGSSTSSSSSSGSGSSGGGSVGGGGGGGGGGGV